LAAVLKSLRKQIAEDGQVEVAFRRFLMICC
jgi:hypothetical protein